MSFLLSQSDLIFIEFKVYSVLSRSRAKIMVTWGYVDYAYLSAWHPVTTIIVSCFSFVTVMTDYLPVRIQSEPVLKFNTGVLRCQVPQSAASYTKVVSWTRGSTRLYPSARGGKKNLQNHSAMKKTRFFANS